MGNRNSSFEAASTSSTTTASNSSTKERETDNKRKIQDLEPHLMEVIDISSDEDYLSPSELPTPNEVRPLSYQLLSQQTTRFLPAPKQLKDGISPSGDEGQARRYPGVELNGHASSENTPSIGNSRETEDDLVSYEEYFYSTEPGYYVKDVTRPPGEGNKKIPSFRCDMCSKKIIGNIRFMEHLHGHFFKNFCVNGSKDLIDLCRYCLRRFSTPHDMQMHVVRSHFGLTSELAQCRICEQTFEDEYMFAFHLRETHPPRDMPYICEACRFRTSSYAEFVDHFTREHSNTNLLYCMFCLSLHRLREINSHQSLYYSDTFIRHIRMHYNQVSANNSKPCSKCRLTFNTTEQCKSHEIKCHKGKPFKQGVREDKLHGTRKINTKTLHLLKLPERLEHMRCLECSRYMSLSLHYRSYRQCTRIGCGYATCCHFNFKTHGEYAHRSFDIFGVTGSYRGGPPRDRPLPIYLQCECGHRNVFGDSMASHLAECDYCEGPRASIVPREQPLTRKVNLKKFALIEPEAELLKYMNLRRIVRRNNITQPPN